MANGPSSGDFTGRQKAQMNKDQAKANEERAAEMSMATEAHNVEEQDGVFDAQSQERVDEPRPSHMVEDVEESAPSGFPQPGDVEPVLTGKEAPEELAPILASRKAFSQPVQPGRVRSAMATIRVDQDIDDMTYGMRNGEPNNYTFREGLSYRVPVEVADHLNDRGLVRQWVSS